MSEVKLTATVYKESHIVIQNVQISQHADQYIAEKRSKNKLYFVFRVIENLMKSSWEWNLTTF